MTGGVPVTPDRIGAQTDIMNMESGNYEWERGQPFPSFTDYRGRLSSEHR